MKKKLIFSNFQNYIFFTLFYFSLILGFYFDENLNFGSSPDWYHTNLPVIKDLAIDLKRTLLNYDNYGHRHSPVYLIFLSLLAKLNLSFDLIRFLHLNISLLLIYFFYKCLLFKFFKVDKNILIILSLSIYLSPTFRSLAIWPDSRIIGLIFFTISIYEFLKFQKNNLEIHVWKSVLYLVFSSYISPNFSVFIIYLFYYFLKKTNLKTLFFISLFCLVAALPAVYYLFILDVNFLTAGGTPGVDKNQNIRLNFNFANKILIISSIILFQLIPFLINNKFIVNFINSIKENIILVSIFFFFNFNIF